MRVIENKKATPTRRRSAALVSVQSVLTASVLEDDCSPIPIDNTKNSHMLDFRPFLLIMLLKFMHSMSLSTQNV